MQSEQIKRFIREMPKGENHIHIEGSIPTAAIMKLAARHHVPVPYQDAAQMSAHFQKYVVDLDTFLDCYRIINEVCIDEQDYYDAVIAIAEDAKEQNIIYRELMLDFPWTANPSEAFGRVIRACGRARREAQERLGVDMAIMVCLDRTQTPEACLEYVKGFEPYLDIIDAVGLDYDEVGHPPAEHRASFLLAERMGLYRGCHCSEVGPEYVWEALEELHCDRIDHGACAVEDARLVEYLADREILLTECPTSNVKTGLYPTLGAQPLKRLMESGVKCSLNSDDPAFFGNLVLEYERAAEEMDLEIKDLAELNRNALKYSIKGQSHLPAFERWLEAWMQENG